MGFFRDLAYGTYIGPFPMIALVGFATYSVIVATAIMASGKRWSKCLRRVPVKVHRVMGGLAIVLATLHLLMGLALYM